MKRKLDANDVPSVEKTSEPTKSSHSESTTFENFNLDPRLLQAVAKSQFTSPTEVQAQAIPPALEGKDILVKSKTGSGKTLAYVLPCIQSVLRRKTNNSKEKATSVLVLVPTRELADQVTRVFQLFADFCGKTVQAVNATQRVSEAVLNARLYEKPDVVVSTPGKVTQLLASGSLTLDEVAHLVIDEADLVLSYGYEDDIDRLSKAFSKGIQTFLVSATLTAEIDQLKEIFTLDPVTVQIEDQEEHREGVKQFTVKCGEEEKFLLLFVIFKLKLVKGKCIIFVGELDRSYRIKLYLEQFGIKSCVLNSELPVNSRLHVVQEFNKGIYDILIAADDQEVIGGIIKKSKAIRGEAEDLEVGSDEDESEPAHKKHKTSQQKDFGVSRGIDFQNVACVLNFDLPTSAKAYTHRIGRTARAGKRGMALSFVVPKDDFGKHRPSSIPSARHDERVLEKIKARHAKKGQQIEDYHFDLKQVEGFRYRMNDALRAVTANAIREARTREIRQELLKSDRLRKHFEDNPEDLRALRHDSGTGGVVRIQGHMKHIPEYLLPKTLGKASGQTGLVKLNEGSESRQKKQGASRRNWKGRKVSAGRKTDPLKSFRSGRNKN